MSYLEEQVVGTAAHLLRSLHDGKITISDYDFTTRQLARYLDRAMNEARRSNAVHPAGQERNASAQLQGPS